MAKMIPFAQYMPDLSNLNSGASGYIKNVLPTQDGYAPFKGWTGYASALAGTCRGYFYAHKSDNSIVVFAATSTRVYAMSNTTLTWTDVSKGGSGGAGYSTVSGSAQWQFAQFNNYVIAVQANTVPQVFDLSSSTAFADLAGSPPQAAYIAIVNRFVVLSGLLSYPYRIQWSALNDVTGWTPALDYSDYQDFPDGGVVRGVVGGEMGIVCQDSAMRRMIFSPGSDIVFQIGEVLQAAEHVARPHVPRRDLALDPHRAPRLDEAADRVVESGDGGRRLGGRLARAHGIGRRRLAGHGVRLERRHPVLSCRVRLRAPAHPRAVGCTACAQTAPVDSGCEHLGCPYARSPRSAAARAPPGYPRRRTEEGAAGRPARLLRRRRPCGDRGREGARALRRAGLRAQADRAQHPRRDRARGGGSDLRRRGRRGARGRARRLQRPRRLAGRRGGGIRSRPAGDRRDLPARDQGAPRGGALRARRLRDPADRPRGPRRGRGHRGRGARARHDRQLSRARRHRRGARPVQGRLALADHPVGRRDHGDRAPAARAVPAAAGPALATTSATPPRTVRWRSRRSRRTPIS